MKSLEYSIIELITKNPCVIIPEFGGFVSSYQSASIDIEKGQILPPDRRVLFNPRLTKDDGLLAHSISQKNNISYSDALVWISTKVANWKILLQNGGKINLDGIGELVINSEKQINLISNSNQILALESFGLKICRLEKAKSSINLETDLNNKDEGKLSVQKNEQKQTNDFSFSWKKTIKLTAAACLIPLLFFTVWIPLKTDFLESGVLPINELNPFYEKKNSVYKKNTQAVLNEIQKIKIEDTFEKDLSTLSNETRFYSYPLSENFYIPVKINEKADLNTKNKDKKLNNSIKENRFKFVLGSFSNKINADNLLSILNKKNFSVQIQSYQSFYRVIVDETSKETKNELINLGYSPWKLKKISQ
ncbi:MAG: HU-CCDC81 and SPOR domain-containing protein [Flavobacteriia bacterium]|nr:HU-CCDC81 and SPOR domain-containing protein [Flavobacteriia bacterium]